MRLCVVTAYTHTLVLLAYPNVLDCCMDKHLARSRLPQDAVLLRCCRPDLVGGFVVERVLHAEPLLPGGGGKGLIPVPARLILGLGQAASVAVVVLAQGAVTQALHRLLHHRLRHVGLVLMQQPS